MVTIVLLLTALVFVLALLDLAALRWGVDSTDSLDSSEWERRQRWHGYGGVD